MTSKPKKYKPENIISTAQELQDLLTEKAFEERARIDQDGETDSPPENTYKEPTSHPSKDAIERNERDGAVPPITPVEWKETHEEYNWIPAAFEARIGPHPENFTAAIDWMKKAYTPFSEAGSDTDIFTDIDQLDKATDGFNGSSASSFKVAVVAKLDTIAKNNRELVQALGAQYKSTKKLYQKSYEDLFNLVEEARQSASDLPRGSDVKVNWGMANAIATIAAGAAVSSTSAVAFFTAMAGLAAAKGAKDDDPSTSLNATSVKQLEDRIKEGLERLDQDREKASKRLERRLKEFQNGIDEYREKGLTITEPSRLRNFEKPDKAEYTDTFRPDGHDPD